MRFIYLRLKRKADYVVAGQGKSQGGERPGFVKRRRSKG